MGLIQRQCFLSSSFNCNRYVLGQVQRPVTGLPGHRSSKLYSRSTRAIDRSSDHAVAAANIIGFFLYHLSVIQRVFGFTRRRVIVSHPQTVDKLISINGSSENVGVTRLRNFRFITAHIYIESDEPTK